MGWGRSNRGNGNSFRRTGYYERVLQKLRVPASPISACESRYGLDLDPFYMCAGGIDGNSIPLNNIIKRLNGPF